MGPYSLEELKNGPRLFKNTLVRRKFAFFWVKARYVKELNPLLEDELNDENQDVEDEEIDPSINVDILVDGIKSVPPYIDILIIVSIALLLWFILMVFN